MRLEELVKENYDATLKNVPNLEVESKYTKRIRELVYLNIKWFMVTLLTRKDRMSMSNSLEVRVPFADYRVVEYAYNIPPEMRFADGREKGILRRALKGILPEEILLRKKSPYPKTHNPKYTEVVQKWMFNILSDKTSPILDLIDINEVTKIVSSGGSYYTKPWFGQLMTGPQLMAYLIQIDAWLRLYKVQIEI